jgi:integrase
MEDVDIQRSAVEVEQSKGRASRTVTVPPSVRTGLKEHLRRLRRRTDETNPLLFGHRGIPDVDRIREIDDVEETTKLATRVMQSFDS